MSARRTHLVNRLFFPAEVLRRAPALSSGAAHAALQFAGIRRAAFVLCGVLLAGGCSRQGATAPGGSGPDAAGAIPLPGRVLFSPGTPEIPQDLALVGENLVLITPGVDSIVRVVRAADGKEVAAVGRSGSAPGEFTAPWCITADPGSPNRFWVYDLQLARLTPVSLDPRASGGATVGTGVVHLAADGPANSPVWTGRNRLVSPGFFVTAGRLAEFDATGTVLKMAGASPPGDTAIPVQVRNHAFQSTARYEPAVSRIALGTRNADRIEIYRPDGTLVAAAHGPRNFDPVYEVVERRGYPSLATGDDLRFGYVGLAVSPQHVYGLYSGRLRGEAPGQANLGSLVHVYDWNARLHKIYTLDEPAYAIAVDERARKLYTLRAAPMPAILEYTLP